MYKLIYPKFRTFNHIIRVSEIEPSGTHKKEFLICFSYFIFNFYVLFYRVLMVGSVSTPKKRL